MQNFIDKTYYAAIYLRLSKEDGDSSTGEKKESNSIANQRKLIEDYLTKHPEINFVMTVSQVRTLTVLIFRK